MTDKAKTSPLLVLTTVAKKTDAARISEALVAARLAACVTVLPAAESRYLWKGRPCQEREFVLLIKTLRGAYRKLEARLKAIHPYECPEIIALPASAGGAGYLQWLRDSVG